MTLILALASSNFCEYGPKNDPNFSFSFSNFCEYGPKNDPNFDRPKMTLILTGLKRT